MVLWYNIRWTSQVFLPCPCQQPPLPVLLRLLFRLSMSPSPRRFPPLLVCRSSFQGRALVDLAANGRVVCLEPRRWRYDDGREGGGGNEKLLGRGVGLC